MSDTSASLPAAAHAADSKSMAAVTAIQTIETTSINDTAMLTFGGDLNMTMAYANMPNALHISDASRKRWRNLPESKNVHVENINENDPSYQVSLLELFAYVLLIIYDQMLVDNVWS